MAEAISMPDIIRIQRMSQMCINKAVFREEERWIDSKTKIGCEGISDEELENRCIRKGQEFS